GPLHVGAILAGASAEVLSSLARYGAPLGEAFQVRDDVEGATGGDLDLAQARPTVVLAKAFELSDGRDRAYLEERLGRGLLPEAGRVAEGTNAGESVDVLVVGAGPGGSTAAYHLARHGVDVALVDKASFPREKVCGDGLTPRVVKLLLEMGIDTSDPGFARVEGLRIYGRSAFLELPWPA